MTPSDWSYGRLNWIESTAHVASIALAFKAGFTSEGPGEAGLAHFAEHMLMAARRDGEPYRYLESRGYLLSASTSRDFMTITLTGPHGGIIEALRNVLHHIQDKVCPHGATEHQAAVIRNEVLHKTHCRPWLDPWRQLVERPDACASLRHDPIVSPALQMRTYEKLWDTFLETKLVLSDSHIGVALNPAHCGNRVLDYFKRRARWPSRNRDVPDVASLGPIKIDSSRSQISLPISSSSAQLQVSGMIVLFALMRGLAASAGRPTPGVKIGLFDEWFGEVGDTAARSSWSGYEFADVEMFIVQHLERLCSECEVARVHLEREWQVRLSRPPVVARTMAWSLAAGQAFPAQPFDSDAVMRAQTWFTKRAMVHT